MSGMVAKIKSIIEDLPTSEKNVADFTMENIEKVPYLSIYDIAEGANVSVASVSRLAQKVGCNNFKTFKIQLAQDIDSALSAIHEGITHEDNDKECVKKIFGCHISSLEDTLKILDIENLIKVAKKIATYQKVYFIGAGSSGHIAHDGAMRFAHLGIFSQAYTDPFEIALYSLQIPQDSVVITISHTGRTATTINSAQVVQKNGAYTVAISNYPESALCKQCDTFFSTAFHETWAKASAISSRVAQICLIDALQVLVARNLREISMIDRVNELMENEFRSNKRIK